MKAIYKTILILLFISVPSISSACHEGDFESSGKGHHKYGKSVGILQFTENSTISFQLQLPVISTQHSWIVSIILFRNRRLMDMDHI